MVGARLVLPSERLIRFPPLSRSFYRDNPIEFLAGPRPEPFHFIRLHAVQVGCLWIFLVSKNAKARKIVADQKKANSSFVLFHSEFFGQVI